MNKKPTPQESGAKGGRAKNPNKGFGANRERARQAGLKGLEKARQNRIKKQQGS